MPAAWVKPFSTGEVTRLTSQPLRSAPSSHCMAPAMMAIQQARVTQWALPGSAMPASDAPISRLVRAVGPTPRRGELLHSTATSEGSRAA